MGHEDRLRELYDGCYRRLVGQLFAFCGDLTEAEDAVQEAFVRALTRPRTMSRLDNPEAWLRTVAINVSRRRFRRAARFRGLLDRELPSQQVAGLSPDHVALVAGLRRLPAELREVIALFHVADLRIRDIAELLGVPEGTVKARLSRGRARLATHLDPYADDKEADHV